MKKIILIVFFNVLLFGAYAQSFIEVSPKSPTPNFGRNCYPFGSDGIRGSRWSPYMGFVYKNIPAFNLNPGDKISFDMLNINDVDIQRSIYISATTVNGGDVALEWKRIVFNQFASGSRRGDKIKGNFDLIFEIQENFNFSGGGLIIAFACEGCAADLGCDQMLNATTSSDVSNQFVKRFFRSGSLTNGSSVGDNSTTFLTGFKLTLNNVDNTPPVLSGIPSDITVPSNAIPVAPTVAATDDVDGIVAVAFEETRTNGACDDEYILTRTWSATDAAGNTATESQTITVTDGGAPTAIAQNFTVQLDASGNATVTPGDINNGSTDACTPIENLTLSVSPSSFTCENVGDNTVTLTVTDEAGNASTATATVTVEDNINPNIVVNPNIIVELDATGTATLVTTDVDGGSTDNCGIASLLINDAPSVVFSCADVGFNDIQLKVIDVNGNESTANATVEVKDIIAPTTVKQDITIALDASGIATVTPADIDDGSTDNCGIASLSINGSPAVNFDCTNIGINTVELKIVDINGNESVASANVTVEDNIDPVAVAQDVTITLDVATGKATITPEQINNGSSDNCGVASLELDRTDFDCNDAGEEVIVNLTVSDATGNSATAQAKVTVNAAAPQPISAVLEKGGKVVSNEDGTFTAFFGYDNKNACPVEIAVGDDNFFTPAPADRGQTVLFEPGRKVEAFTVVFSEGNLVWTLTSPDGSRRTSTASVPNKPIRPILEDIEFNGDGTFTASFGYLNENDIPIYIPAGDNNRFTPGTDVNGLPILFEPGRHQDVFTVTFPCGGVEVWTLKSPNGSRRTATASDNGFPDFDNDGKVDVCDEDDDNDGIDDKLDKYPKDPTNNNSGVIFSRVWDDQDGDGIQDSKEPGLKDVTVKLLNENNSVRKTAKTNSDGLVAFFDISAGTKVKLELVTPKDHAITLKDQGSNDSKDSDANPNNKRTLAFTTTTSIIKIWDIGLWAPGALESFVWDDQDGDGIQDSNEPGLKDVTVKLLNANNSVRKTARTNNEGIVRFSGVPANTDVKLEVVRPKNHAITLRDQGTNESKDSDVNPSNGRTATFRTSQGSQLVSSIDIGLWAPGTVETYVWDDRDGDGIQDSNEPGLKDVTVKLLNANNSVRSTSRTNNEGVAKFNKVPADVEVKLEVVRPANHAITLRDKGTNDFKDSDANPSNGRTATFKAGKGSHVRTDVDFGLWAPGTVETYVWDDRDGDGIQDSNEPGLKDVTVKLLNANNSVRSTSRTNNLGIAKFNKVPAEVEVKLEVVRPANHAITQRDQGTNDFKDSDANPSNGRTATFRAGKGSHVRTDVDFGLWAPGTVETYVWDDRDGDGIQDSNEPGLKDVTVKLLNSNNSVRSTARTNNDGVAVFNKVPADVEVKLEVVRPTNHAITLRDQGTNDFKDSDANPSNGRTATFRSGQGNQRITKMDIGLWAPGTVETYVWDDQDGDGIQDSNEPGLKDVTVKLLNANNSVRSTARTNSDGIAAFNKVPADVEVKLEVVKPANHAIALRDQGTNDFKDSDANPSNGRTATFKAGKGSHVRTDVDFGLWAPGTVETYVWDDQDGDGIQDSNEPGLKDVTVKLLNANNSVRSTARTNSDGIAAFNKVPADVEVKLEVVKPANHAIALRDQGTNDFKDSDANPSNGRTATFRAGKGSHLRKDVDFGLIATSGNARMASVALNTENDSKEDLSIEVAEIMLYPNPSSSIMNIESGFEFTKIRIFSLDGRMILNEKLENKVKSSVINVSELATGQYVLFIEGKTMNARRIFQVNK